MGWCIALAVLALLAAIPLGVDARYDARGPEVKLLVGPVRARLYPRPAKKAKKAPEKKAPEKKEQAPAAQQPQSTAEAKPAGGSWKDFIPLVKTALAFLGDFRRKLRIDLLECDLVLGGTDPAKLAMDYGRAWAAVGNLLTAMERCFAIRRRDVQVQCDFTSPETRVTFRAKLTMTLGRLLVLAVRYGLRALKDYMTLRKSRKGGIKHE